MTEAADPPAAPAAHTGGLHVEETPPPPSVILHRLRTMFPHWGFLHDPHTGMWTALRGTEEHGVTIVQPDALALRMAVEAAQEPTSGGL